MFALGVLFCFISLNTLGNLAAPQIKKHDRDSSRSGV